MKPGLYLWGAACAASGGDLLQNILR
jgi:hypothetical protein